MSGNGQTRLAEDERRRMVAEAAYYRALSRGFAAGGEVDDWLAAEREIEQRCSGSGGPVVSRQAARARTGGKAATSSARSRSVQ